MKYFSPNRPHPESRAEVPPTGNFSPSKNDRYCFLLAPPSPISPPSTFYTLTAACTCIYLPPALRPLSLSAALPVAAFLAFRRLIQCCCKKTDISRNAAAQRGSYTRGRPTRVGTLCTGRHVSQLVSDRYTSILELVM